MTSHYKIIFNEYDKAKEILQSGFEKGKLSKYELATLAKYYYDEGNRGNKLKKLLVDFCELHSVDFNEVVYRDAIIYAIKIAEKYEIKNIDFDVSITMSEINKIISLPLSYAKILFVMLVLSKISFKENYIKHNEDTQKGRYFCHQKLNKIMQIAKVYLNPIELKKAKHFLDAECKYISATELGVDNWEVLIIDEQSDSIITINNFNNIMNYFPFTCEKCHKIIEKSKRQKYCDDCKTENRKNSDKFRKKIKK